ncbi:exported protein of unknown function [Desulfovibrio sp. 86]|nr:exported protein of unknown function [Desulfovibrio sp. 86]
MTPAACWPRSLAAWWSTRALATGACSRPPPFPYSCAAAACWPTGCAWPCVNAHRSRRQTAPGGADPAAPSRPPSRTYACSPQTPAALPVWRCAVPAVRTAEAQCLFPRSPNGSKRYRFKSYFTTRYYNLFIVKWDNHAATAVRHFLHMKNSPYRCCNPVQTISLYLEQFHFEIALADAKADARRRDVSAASAVARRACLNRWREPPYGAGQHRYG